MTARIFQGLLLSSLLLFLSWSTPALANADDSQTVGKVVIYLGVLPAEMIRGHPAQHTESSMHGGLAAADGEYHILIALFDAKTGSRITGADVTARVSEIGLVGLEKKLQPMEIAGTETYGNYFRMAGNGPFRINLTIRVADESQEIKAEFEHRHQ